MEARRASTRLAEHRAKLMQQQAGAEGPEDFGDEASLEEPPGVDFDLPPDADDDSDQDSDDSLGSAEEEGEEDHPAHPPPSSSDSDEMDQEEEPPPQYHGEEYREFNSSVFEGWKRKERANFSPPHGPAPHERVRIPDAANSTPMKVPFAAHLSCPASPLTLLRSFSPTSLSSSGRPSSPRPFSTRVQCGRILNSNSPCLSC